MPDEVIIKARVPGKLRRRLEELGVNISGVVRTSLEGELKRLEMGRLQKRAEDAAQILGKIPRDEIVKAIRAGRESH